MMKKAIALMAVSMMFGAAVMAAEETGTKYGKGVEVAQATSIASLLEKPADFLGKTVRVDGVVTSVCETRGCWMMIAESEGGKSIRIKVDDGVIIFPVSAKGHKTSAEGVFEVIEVTPEQAAEHAKEEAAEKGDEEAKEGAASCVSAGKNYRIKGTGAIVY